MMFHNTKLNIFLLVVVAIQALPTSNEVSVSNVTHWGSGCSQDTTNFAVELSEDGSSITATFGAFDVKLSPQSASTEFCGIGVDLSFSAGKQFAVASSTYCDVIDVGSGVTATHLLSYTFSTYTDLSTTRHIYTGPLKGTFDSTDEVPEDQRVWSECGDPLTLLITNRGSVTDGGSTTGAGGTSYFNSGSVITSLEWRSC